MCIRDRCLVERAFQELSILVAGQYAQTATRALWAILHPKRTMHSMPSISVHLPIHICCSYCSFMSTVYVVAQVCFLVSCVWTMLYPREDLHICVRARDCRSYLAKSNFTSDALGWVAVRQNSARSSCNISLLTYIRNPKMPSGAATRWYVSLILTYRALLKSAV